MLSIEGNIVNIDTTTRGRIEIGDDGIITSVSAETGKADVVLKDELIFPGFIDLHVHARECADHSQDYKEDFTSAGEAAINVGVVAFADMPNNPVPPIDDKSYNEKYQLSKRSPVEVLLYAGIGPKTNPLSKAVPYKVYMGKSVGDLFFESLDELDNVLEKYRGQNVSFHCEDPKVLKQSERQSSHELQRPPEAEISAVDFALGMIEKYGLRGKICHCSTKEALEKIITAKNRGVKVTVEVTPHHLYFDNSTKLQMNPPLRSREDRLALIAALKNGDIDFLATDHAPHAIEEKVPRSGIRLSRKKSVSGLTHLDTYGPFVSWLMKEHKFSAQDVVRVCSYNPGQFFNQFSSAKYGKIEPGFAGSLAIMDMDNSVKIEKSMLKTKAGWSPFEGITFPGSVAMTIIKGKIYQN